MRTDVEMCRVIAAHVEDGVLQEAVLLLATAGAVEREHDLVVRDVTQERPVLKLDLSGEDGNAFFLVSKVIHGLVKARREASACEIFRAYSGSGSYDDLVSLVKQYVIVGN